MGQAQALHHLRTSCIPKDPSDSALIEEWTAAKSKLGVAAPNAGFPSVSPLAKQYKSHIQAVVSQAAFQPGGSFCGAHACLVEIDPILSVQFAIDLDRIAYLCGALRNPSLEETLDVCLPLKPQSESFQTLSGAQSILLKSRSMNIKLSAGGLFNDTFLGVKLGVSSPHVRVVRYRGRCYIHNGFHRAVGLRMAGVTHMPCLIKDVADESETGISENATFSAKLLESDNPPTLAHFTQGRAREVTLRALSRVVHVSWAEYTVPDE
jgi:hypothetical protein